MAEGMREPGLNRRELLAAGAAGGAALTFERAGGRAFAGGGSRVVERIDFASLTDGAGWGARWRCVGVANLRRAGREGLL
ncbi:MAG: hypothetical protein ACR2OC_06930, partial [Solirubrobacterales bacterium]